MLAEGKLFNGQLYVKSESITPTTTAPDYLQAKSGSIARDQQENNKSWAMGDLDIDQEFGTLYFTLFCVG